MCHSTCFRMCEPGRVLSHSEFLGIYNTKKTLWIQGNPIRTNARAIGCLQLCDEIVPIRLATCTPPLPHKRQPSSSFLESLHQG